jgi:rhamnulokinase
VALGRIRKGKLEMTEIHRFPNRPIENEGHLRWDMHALCSELEKGLTICAQRHTRRPTSIGVGYLGR